MEDNPIVGFARRHLTFSEEYDGGRLFTRGGRRVATPLFLVLLTIGSTDILFALLGLRAPFFPVSGLLDRLV